MANSGRWESGCPKHTTPSSQPSSGFVSITHPHHPLRGQRVEIIRLRRGRDPDLIVRLPDGRHAAIALSSTDYLSSLDSPFRPAAEHLLDLEGLRSVIQLLDRIAQRRLSEPCDGDPSGTPTRDTR
jgi:Family of unknown function (DUF5372)